MILKKHYYENQSILINKTKNITLYIFIREAKINGKN